MERSGAPFEILTKRCISFVPNSIPIKSIDLRLLLLVLAAVAGGCICFFRAVAGLGGLGGGIGVC